eukprot:6610961-Alexandrium_andersonii.AAC.1
MPEWCVVRARTAIRGLCSSGTGECSLNCCLTGALVSANWAVGLRVLRTPPMAHGGSAGSGLRMMGLGLGAA